MTAPLQPLYDRFNGPENYPAQSAILDYEPWREILLKLDADLAQIDPDYEILQVKVKFGELRYYIKSAYTPGERRGAQMTELIAQAEQDCWKIDKEMEEQNA